MSEKIRVLLDEETVEKRICEVAAQISEEYKGKEIHMICVLKGGVFFMFPVMEMTPNQAEL